MQAIEDCRALRVDFVRGHSHDSNVVILARHRSRHGLLHAARAVSSCRSRNCALGLDYGLRIAGKQHRSQSVETREATEPLWRLEPA